LSVTVIRYNPLNAARQNNNRAGDRVLSTVRGRLKSGPAIAGHAVLVTVLLYSTIAWASGWPPFAADDAAVVFRGGTVAELTTGASSVLENDFDLERDRLTAVLSRDVKHGTLLLRSDGTFLYRHNGGNKDRDEFKYRAFDGTGFSREATVKITIEDFPNSPPFVVSDVPDQEVMEGFEFRLALAGNFADPDEGDVLQFSASGLPGSGSLRLDEDLGVLAGTPVAADVRDQSYTIRVTATDRQGASVSLTFELTIIRRNEPPFVVAPVADQEAVENIAYSLSLATNFDDPDEGDVLRFSSSGLPASGSLQLDAGTGLLSGTPTREDARDEPYTIVVQVTDRAGATATMSFRLLILRDNRSDLVLGIASATNAVTVGEDARWNIEILNKGPADLQEGQLFAGWVTSGPPLTVTAPDGASRKATATIRLLVLSLQTIRIPTITRILQAWPSLRSSVKGRRRSSTFPVPRWVPLISTVTVQWTLSLPAPKPWSSLIMAAVHLPRPGSASVPIAAEPWWRRSNGTAMAHPTSQWAA
jgi:hypothetical protein